jgi:hypothetical protein
LRKVKIKLKLIGKYASAKKVYPTSRSAEKLNGLITKPKNNKIVLAMNAGYCIIGSRLYLLRVSAAS